METIELREYLKPLWKWWWLLLVATVIAATSSAAYSYQQPLHYRSSTTLMVGAAVYSPNPSANDLYLASQLAMAHAEMARRATIRQATQEALGLTWLPPYSVWVVPNTQLIEIAVTDTDPARAKRVAEELVRQLVLETPSGRAEVQRETFIEQQLDDLEASIRATTEEKQRLEAQLLDMFSARQIADTRTQIAALDAKIAAHQASYSALLATSQRSSTNKLTVIEPASLPTSPLSRNLKLNVALAGMLGFALAAIGAYSMEYIDDSIRTEGDVQRQLQVPTLAEIPRLWSKPRGNDHRLIATQSPSLAVDAYSELRYALIPAHSDRLPRSVLITSPNPQVGKSVTAANLGVILALSGLKVILVDADLRAPTLHHRFRLGNHRGLSSILMGMEAKPESLLQATAFEGLSVLPSGPLPPNPTVLVGSRQMQDLLQALHAHADIVILDSPPVTAAADASIIATQAEAVVLVISARKTKGRDAKRAVRTLSQISTPLLGVVLNDVAAKDYRYGMLYYGHQMGASGPTSTKPATRGLPKLASLPRAMLGAPRADGSATPGRQQRQGDSAYHRTQQGE